MMGVTQKKTLTGNQPPAIGHLEVKIRSFAETILLPRAWGHAIKAWHIHESGAEEHRTEEIGESVEAIIEAAAAMEAFTNNVGIRTLSEKEWIDYDKSHPNWKNKWKKIKNSKITIDLGSEPWQGIQTLFELRDLAMHHKPAWSAPVSSVHGNTSEFAAKFNYESACQSVRCVKQAIIAVEKCLEEEVTWLALCKDSDLPSSRGKCRG